MVFACNPLVFNDLHCGKGAERWTTHLLQIWLRPLLPKPMLGRPWPWLLRRLPRYFLWHAIVSEITITKILDEKHCGETVLMSHNSRMTLPTTTCHSWHGHSWRHMTQLIYDLITDVDHLLVMGKSHCCGQLFVYLAQKNRSSCSMRRLLPKSNASWLPRTRLVPSAWLNRKNVLETTLLSGWCSPPVHLFANSLKTRGYLLNAQPRKFLLW